MKQSVEFRVELELVRKLQVKGLVVWSGYD